MKIKFILFGAPILALGLSTISCRSAAASPQRAAPGPQAMAQEPAPPPPPDAAQAPPPPDPNGPPPPRGRRRPGPQLASAPCGPDTPPRPVAPQVTPSTVTGTIRQFNFGPEGELSGFLLSNGVQVNFPREISEQVGDLARTNTQVSVVGFEHQGWTGKTIVDAASVIAKGQTIGLPTQPVGTMNPPPPPPPANGAEAGPPQR
jgi:hypothetical protein